MCFQALENQYVSHCIQFFPVQTSRIEDFSSMSVPTASLSFPGFSVSQDRLSQENIQFVLADLPPWF